MPFGSEVAQVVIVGAGQAGLAVSHELGPAGVDHVVLERGRVGETWRGRWDSFCLVTPNWTMSLPGYPYAGDDPEGFDARDEIVRYLERYASSFGAPVHEGVKVESLESDRDGLLLRTSDGELRAKHVVLATGAYQRPHRPVGLTDIPPAVLVIDAEDYTNPDGLPPGGVLVVGSGQTGCQVAEELHESGREVFLACGRAPWVPRRLEGRDIVTWLGETDFFETPLSALPSPLARLTGNAQLTGRAGGRDLNYRVLQARGVHLLGRLAGVGNDRAYFAGDLLESVAFGDARYGDMCRALREQLPAKGRRVPELPEPPPFAADPPSEVKLDRFGAIIFTSGFRPDYARWVHLPAFDDLGFPLASEGASTVVPGLYFVGVHFLRKRKSSLLFGVGEDASIAAGTIVQRLESPGTREQSSPLGESSPPGRTVA
jgi:putative flavoprotein involved in K+ transport